MRRNSILVKTFIHLMILMIMLIAIIHLSIFFIYNKIYIDEKNEDINSSMDYISQIIKYSDISDENSILLTAYAKNNGINIKVVTNEGVLFYQGNDFFIDFENDENSIFEIYNVDEIESTLVKTRNIKMNNEDIVKVQISANLQVLRVSRKIALSLLPYTLLLSIIISIIFSYIYSKKLTNPIKKINVAVNDMTKLKKGISIDIKNNDEIGQLANDINILYNDLTKTIENFKNKNEEVLHIEKERLNYFRTTSHELKTPLAKLSILVENMKYNVGKYKDHNKYLTETLGIINDLSLMISDLLEGVKIIKSSSEKQNISVKSLLIEVLSEYQMIAKSKQVSIKQEITGDFFLQMDSTDFKNVISNIISNAVKFTKVNGEIISSLDDEMISIYNEADEIPNYKLNKIWKGEYLLSDGKKGSNGMGMFIVKTILDKYKISYSFKRIDNGYEFRLSKHH